MPIFTSERVSSHLTRIITPCGVCMYLAEGTERAALLDTGFGFGELKGYVDSLTPMPYVVLLSHGHMDHAGGDILAGTDAAIDADFIGQKGRLGRPENHPGKVGNILYDPGKLT